MKERHTRERHGLEFIGLTRVALQLALGHRGRLAQVEERTPATHRRLFRFNRRPLPVIKNKNKIQTVKLHMTEYLGNLTKSKQGKQFNF